MDGLFSAGYMFNNIQVIPGLGHYDESFILCKYFLLILCYNNCYGAVVDFVYRPGDKMFIAFFMPENEVQSPRRGGTVPGIYPLLKLCLPSSAMSRANVSGPFFPIYSTHRFRSDRKMKEKIREMKLLKYPHSLTSVYFWHSEQLL